MDQTSSQQTKTYFKLPINKPLLLYTTFGKFCCTVVYFNDKLVSVKDISEVISTPDGPVSMDLIKDAENPTYWDRNSITGFHVLDQIIYDSGASNEEEPKRNNILTLVK